MDDLVLCDQKNKDMKNPRNKRYYAILTGTSLLTMALVAIVIMGVVYNRIFNMDLETFTRSYEKMQSLLVLGLIGWIVILLCDIGVSWGIYKFYREKHKARSKITGLLRFVYSIILLFAIAHLAYGSLLTFENEKSYLAVQHFQKIWSLGLIVFGGHLLILATMVFDKSVISFLIGGTLLMAGIGYVLTNCLNLFMIDYEQIRAGLEGLFILPMIVSEVGLAIWLLAKGGKP